MKRMHRGMLFCSTVAAFGAVPAVLAAEPQQLEEIIVTAQKRTERLIDVPMSITAIKGEELEQRGVSSFQDISFAVPGVSMREDGPGSYTIFMRGLSNQYGSGALVGVYLDEAPLSLTGFDQMDTRVLDLERVEVLKGPQGTLYGQGAVAGAIRYITNKPNLESYTGRLELSEAMVEDGDPKTVVTAVANLPVVKDVFGLRIAGTVERGGGWQDQPQANIENGNDQNLDHVRLLARWKPTDAFTADAMIAIHRNETKLGLGYENPDRTITVGVDRAKVLIPKEYDYDLYNLNLDYDFGPMNLVSSTTYIDHDHKYPFSYIGGPETFYGGDLEGNDARHVTAQQFSQELRLVSNTDGKFNWTVGAFYRTLDNKLTAVYDTLFAGVVYPDAFYLADDSYDQISVYADASYKLTQRLTVGAGVRYFSDDQKTFDGFAHEKDSFDSVDPRFYATFALNDQVNVYASAASGFRSGGFNQGTLPNYKPESLWSYELGIKGTTAGGALNFELAAYHSDYDDMLRRGLVFVQSTGQFDSLTGNIGKARINGVEGGVTWRVLEPLTLSATASYIDSEITEVNATDATSQKGDPVDYVPELSYTLGANYAFQIGDLPGYARVDYSYRDKVPYVDRTSFPAENLPQWSDDISLVDARIGLQWNKVNIELFGTNLTNENKWIDPYHGWDNANRTRPRMVGLQVGINFE